MGIVNDLIDFFPDEITGQPGSIDTSGTFTPSGDAVTLPCRYEMKIQTVWDRGTGVGMAKTSSASALVAGTPGFDNKNWRFTISSRFSPRTNLTAIAVIPESDETGQCYEEVYFP